MTPATDIRTVEDFPFQVERIAHLWIPLADGTRLAARIWRPVTDEPVPAILEYLPYRKGDGTAPRDDPVGTYHAGHGYAYVRVDLRGTGDSDGVITGEYTEQELADALEVIAWIAAQPWCSGSLGMIGISWGGFNGLQVAALRPPALKAVISMCSTDDRYADDVHYDGGCVLAWDMVPWHTVMLVWDALPPDPDTVGDGWRETWLRRLDETPPFVHDWVAHQRRDGFWKHGSVCEDYTAIEAPVWMVGGWADGYTNAIGRTVEGLPGVAKGLIGPWPHAWPHRAVPGPRIGFLQEAIRWWARWLRDDANGVEDDPAIRAWIQEPVLPAAQHLDRPGRWVSEDAWPPPSLRPERRYLGAGSLEETPGGEVVLTHRGFQHHGHFAGTWCPYGPEADFAPDQREEDALSLNFDTAPLPERLELLGHPRARLSVAADRPLAFVALRLCDVAPDGTSTLLSRGALNLTHRNGHEQPERLTPGERYEVDVELDVLGQVIPAGHRLRLAVSSTYWPWLWPSPEPVELSLMAGEGSWLELPVRPLDADDGPDPGFEPPEQAAPLPLQASEEVPAYHRIERDLVSGRVTMTLNQDGEKTIRYEDGLEVAERAQDVFSIVGDDPLSARVESDRAVSLTRGDWRVGIRTRSTMSCDATTFFLTDTVEAFEGDDRIFERTWERAFPRDHV
jgi:uncharacterized protein